MTFSINWTEVTLSTQEQAVLQSLEKGFKSGSPEWCEAMTILLNHESTVVRGIALDNYAYDEGPNKRFGCNWDETTDEFKQFVRNCALSELNKPAFEHEHAQGMNHASALYVLGIGQCWEVVDGELIAKTLLTNQGDENIIDHGLWVARYILGEEEQPCFNLIQAVQQVAIDPRCSISTRCDAIKALACSLSPEREEWLNNQLNDASWEITATAMRLLLENDFEKYRDGANEFLNNWQGDRPYKLIQIEEVLEDKDAELITKTLLSAVDVYDRLQAAEILLSEENEPSQPLIEAVEKVVFDDRCLQFMKEEAVRVRATVKDSTIESWLCGVVGNLNAELGAIAVEELLNIDLEKYRNLALDFINDTKEEPADIFSVIQELLDKTQ